MEREEEMRIRSIMDEKYHDEIATVRVTAAILNSPKHISNAIKLLNNLLPVPSLQHLKRVKRRDGKTYVILDLVREEEEGDATIGEDFMSAPKRMKLDEMAFLENLKSKGFDYEEMGVAGVEIWEVPKHGPKTRAQYEKAMEYWPVNFHPEKKIETMMSDKVFEDDEWKYHVRNMKLVLKMADEKRTNAAMIFDFNKREMIAVGFDRVEHHPLQHAIMVALDAVAGSQNGGAWNLPLNELTGAQKVPEGLSAEEAPYLCTGYDAYVALEPCVMCAMSLVHSRIRRVFFHVRNHKKGALVSRCQVHTIKDLNHHYEVFEVTKSEKCNEN